MILVVKKKLKRSKSTFFVKLEHGSYTLHGASGSYAPKYHSAVAPSTNLSTNGPKHSTMFGDGLYVLFLCRNCQNSIASELSHHVTELLKTNLYSAMGESVTNLMEKSCEKGQIRMKLPCLT
jgi:hypothetical protein